MLTRLECWSAVFEVLKNRPLKIEIPLLQAIMICDEQMQADNWERAWLVLVKEAVLKMISLNMADQDIFEFLQESLQIAQTSHEHAAATIALENRIEQARSRMNAME